MKLHPDGEAIVPIQMPHDCHRDGCQWEPSGMTLVERNRLGVVMQIGTADCSEVEACRHCGALRLPTVN